MPGEHAKLSASGSKRWLACPGSVVLEALFPESELPYAEEGTRAHELAEAKLRYLTGRIKLEDYNETYRNIDKAIQPGGVSTEMERYVDVYIDYVMDLYDGLRLNHRDAVIFIEERVSYDEYVPGGFGRIDCIILAGKELHIADLKYGKGVAVDAVENPQPRLYALGALQEYGDIYDIDQVTTHIVQPRLNSITTENLTRSELVGWGESIKQVAADAYKGTRVYSAGDHCQFCRARATCRERARHYLSSILNILGGQK